jgi:hypothetical protein
MHRAGMNSGCLLSTDGARQGVTGGTRCRLPRRPRAGGRRVRNADQYTADGASVLPLARDVPGLPCSGERPARAVDPSHGRRAPTSRRAMRVRRMCAKLAAAAVDRDARTRWGMRWWRGHSTRAGRPCHRVRRDHPNLSDSPPGGCGRIALHSARLNRYEFLIGRTPPLWQGGESVRYGRSGGYGRQEGE